MPNVLIGVLTVYIGVIGAPLYCDTWDTELMYDPTAFPWIAISVERYEFWDCGDLVIVYLENDYFFARIYDAGYLTGYYVDDQPIIGDIPKPFAPFDGLSAPGKIINLTQMQYN